MQPMLELILAHGVATRFPRSDICHKQKTMISEKTQEKH